MLLRRVARPLLSVAFIGQGLETLRNPQGAADAARPVVDWLRLLPDPAGRSLPDNPKKLVLANAGVQIGAGILLATGKVPRVASAALAATVVPGNLGAHTFWTENDPERKAEERRSFLADLSLLGGLVIAAADTAGRPSVGWRGRRAAERLTETVSSALSGNEPESWLSDGELGQRLAGGLRSGVEHGRHLVSTAAEKSEPLLEAAIERGAEFAETAREKGADLAETVRERGADLAETARERRRGASHPAAG